MRQRIPLRVDFSVRQRIPFRVDFSVRQQVIKKSQSKKVLGRLPRVPDSLFRSLSLNYPSLCTLENPRTTVPSGGAGWRTEKSIRRTPTNRSGRRCAANQKRCWNPKTLRNTAWRTPDHIAPITRTATSAKTRNTQNVVKTFWYYAFNINHL